MNKRDRVAVTKRAGPERVRVSLVVPVTLKNDLQALADREMRSLNAQCELLLTKGLQLAEVRV